MKIFAGTILGINLHALGEEKVVMLKEHFIESAGMTLAQAYGASFMMGSVSVLFACALLASFFRSQNHQGNIPELSNHK